MNPQELSKTNSNRSCQSKRNMSCNNLIATSI